MAAAFRRALMLSGYSSRTVAGLGTCCSVACRSLPCSLSTLRGPDFYHGRSGYVRHVSHIILKASGKRAFLVDTLTLVRKLEAQGISSIHVEAIISAITEVLNDSLENVTQSFLSQGELQKKPLHYETEKLRNDIEGLRRWTEEHMQHEIGMLKNHVQYEIEKLREHMQHETGKLKEHLQHKTEKLRSEIEKLPSELTSLIYQEMHALRTPIEDAQYAIIKYSIAGIISAAAAGLVVVSIML